LQEIHGTYICQTCQTLYTGLAADPINLCQKCRKPTLRIKFGPNPYGNKFTCSYCRTEFDKEGLWLRLEQTGIIIDMPLCRDCLAAGNLYETIVTFDKHHPSFPLGLA